MEGKVGERWILEQVEVMKITHLQGKVVKCPLDGARVVVEDTTTLAADKPRHDFSCPLCGNAAEA